GEQAPGRTDEERRARGSLHALQLCVQGRGRHPERATGPGERAVAREGEHQPELLPGEDHARSLPRDVPPRKTPAPPQPWNGIGTNPGTSGTRSSHLRIAG